LHTVGSAIGALWAGGFTCPQGGKRRVDEEIDIPADFAGAFKGQPGVRRQRAFPSSQALFWWSFLVVILLTAIVVLIYSAGMGSDVFWTFVALILMAGPLFMLGASFLMFVLLLCFPNLPPEGRYWHYWGRITLGIIAGSLVGLALMVVPFLLLSR
jgi:hypothetical protein